MKVSLSTETIVRMIDQGEFPDFQKSLDNMILNRVGALLKPHRDDIESGKRQVKDLLVAKPPLHTYLLTFSEIRDLRLRNGLPTLPRNKVVRDTLPLVEASLSRVMQPMLRSFGVSVAPRRDKFGIYHIEFIART
jgi:hypothetical protein